MLTAWRAASAAPPATNRRAVAMPVVQAAVLLDMSDPPVCVYRGYGVTPVTDSRGEGCAPSRRHGSVLIQGLWSTREEVALVSSRFRAVLVAIAAVAACAVAPVADPA